MNLTLSQEQAIFHKNGPMLVLAGPGSGKTFVITHRIKTLIEVHSVNPGSILVISFTRAAAAEMKERFLTLMQSSYTPVVFGTFHSIFFSILKQSFHYSKDCIISENEKKLLLRRISASFVQNEDMEEFFQLFLQEFQKEESKNGSFSRDEYAKIYQEYITVLKREHRLDFDQIINQCYDMLTQHSSILQAFQQRFSYILIDEFQDINTKQFQTIRLLAKPDNNLFAVGDDDQAIYGFRGSKPDIMLTFPTIYPTCKQILLNKNFRSGSTIVEHSLSLIQHNKTRFPKDISPFCQNPGVIILKKFETTRQECAFLLSSMKEGLQQGLAFRDMAVLFRIHSGTRHLITALHHANIPFLLKDRLTDIFDHWIIQDILSYLRLAKGESTRQDFVQILEKPSRGIYRSDLTVEWNPSKLGNNFELLEPERGPALAEFIRNMDFLSTLTPASAISFIRYSFGYERFLQNHALKQNLPVHDLFTILEEFQDFAKKTKSLEELTRLIETEKEILRQKPSDLNAVSLMSFHSSKGLEFKRVYLLDCNQEITPYKKAVSPEAIEEERRMFYVAVTRTKKELFLCYLEHLHNKKLAPSQFLKEFYKEETLF